MLIFLIGIAVSFLWNAVPVIKEGAHALLDPTLGRWLDASLSLTFFFIVFVFTLLTTLLQKYCTDQQSIKRLKEEQKALQTQMRAIRDQPEKMLELNTKTMEISMQLIPLALRPVMYTTVPFLLLLRWFTDYFAGVQAEIYGIFNTQGAFLFPNWIWAYIVTSIILSIPLRKMLKVH